MFNTIITTVKTLLRRPSTWVWGALFPIALSTMFMFMFANLSSDGTVDPVPVAVVADEAWNGNADGVELRHFDSLILVAVECGKGAVLAASSKTRRTSSCCRRPSCRR